MYGVELGSDQWWFMSDPQLDMYKVEDISVYIISSQGNSWLEQTIEKF